VGVVDGDAAATETGFVTLTERLSSSRTVRRTYLAPGLWNVNHIVAPAPSGHVALPKGPASSHENVQGADAHAGAAAEKRIAWPVEGAAGEKLKSGVACAGAGAEDGVTTGAGVTAGPGSTAGAGDSRGVSARPGVAAELPTTLKRRVATRLRFPARSIARIAML
jgi:hypothetical protein